jgi:hypothetical protein
LGSCASVHGRAKRWFKWLVEAECQRSESNTLAERMRFRSFRENTVFPVPLHEICTCPAQWTASNDL